MKDGASKGSPRSLSLGQRVFLVALFGLALPLAGAGLWLVQRTASAGEAYLQSRLERSLGDAVHTMGRRSVEARAHLLDLAEDPALGAFLTEALEVPPSGDDLPPSLAGAWERVDRFAARAEVRDGQGNLRLELVRGEGATSGNRPSGALPNRPWIPVRLPVREAPGGERVGTLEVAVPLEVLLPADLWWPGVAGSLLALLDPEDGTTLVPLPVEAELLLQDRFQWGGADWTAVRHRLFEPPVVLALAAPLDPITVPLFESARRGAGVLLLVLLVCSAMVLVSIRGTTRPLREVAGAAEAVARGELGRTVTEAGPDELRRVARAFNAMTANLRATLRRLSRQESVAAVGEFAATLAHEIRNPLSSVRLDLERVRRRTTDGEAHELLDRIVAEIERLDTTVRGALGVARSGTLELEPLDVTTPLEAARHAAEAEFRTRGAKLEALQVEGGGPLEVSGNGPALEQLFLNLLLNAAVAAGRGGRAGVTVRLGRGGSGLRVTVWDDGPGFAEGLEEQAFEPFFSTRPEGTGLGLAVARRIARAHGGEITLGAGEGGGAAVHVDFPRSPGAVS